MFDADANRKRRSLFGQMEGVELKRYFEKAASQNDHTHSFPEGYGNV